MARPNARSEKLPPRSVFRLELRPSEEWCRREEIVYATRTTGAENDIEQATNLARGMVTRWGMSEKVGMVQLAPRQNAYLGGSGGYGGEKPFSEETARVIDVEVIRIIGECHDEARRLLAEHRKELDALA